MYVSSMCDIDKFASNEREIGAELRNEWNEQQQTVLSMS